MTVIKVENLSKQYRIGDIGTGSLMDDFKRFQYRLMGKEDPFLKVGKSSNLQKKSDSKYVWALNDLNFQKKNCKYQRKVFYPSILACVLGDLLGKKLETGMYSTPNDQKSPM